MGVGPMNLVITNDALYQLSYTSEFATYVLYIIHRHIASLFLKIIIFMLSRRFKGEKHPAFPPISALHLYGAVNSRTGSIR